MSYAIGATEPWGFAQLGATGGNVYIWQADVNAQITRADDVMDLVRAVGESYLNAFQHLPNTPGLDILGVALEPIPGGTRVAVVMTPPGIALIHPAIQDAEDIADDVSADKVLQLRFPGAVFTTPQWLELTGPEDKIAFWLEQPVLWKGIDGAPTAAWAARQGAFVGAVDGDLAPLDADLPPLGPAPSSDSSLLALGLAVAMTLGLAYMIWKPEA